MAYLDSTGLQKQIQYIKAYVENQISAIASNGTVNRATADGLGNNIAETYATKAELSAIPQFDIQVVNALPTANISDTTVYLVLSNSGAAGNLYTEYIHVNDTWEKLGEQTTDIDLSDYMPLSGGTLTGNIYTTPYYDATIESPEGGQTLIVSKGHSTKGTPPSEDEWHTLAMAVDSTGSTNNLHKYGQMETAVYANGKTESYLGVYKNEANSTTGAKIVIGYDANGNVYTAAPTPAAADNSTKIATTAYVNTKLSGYSATSHNHNGHYPIVDNVGLTELTSSNNVDDIVTAGTYWWSSDSGHSKPTNAPCNYGKMIVHYLLGTNWILQKVYPHNSLSFYMRYKTSGSSVTWSDWVRPAYTNSSITGNAANVSGTVAIANGGTGATTRLNALKELTNENVGTSANYFLTITSSWGKGGYTSVADAKTVLGLKSAAYTESSAYAAASHTHKYAGSSSAGGAATTLAGTYSGNGGALTPSAVAGGNVKAAMMNNPKGLTKFPTYADCILMDTYTGTDVPWVTMFSIVKQDANPRAFISVGAKGNTTTWKYSAELLTENSTLNAAKLSGLTKAQVTTALGYTPPTTNTTYSNMTAATADAAGKAGLVPAPAAGKQTSFLRGDGTWVVPTNTTYSAGTTALLVTGSDTANRVWPVKQLVDYIKPRSVEFIKGTQTAATGAFTGVTTDAALYDGKTIRYYLPYNGSGNATLNLTLSGGGKTGAKVICWTGTSQLTTHYGAGSVMTLTYVASDDKWHGADYNTNTTNSAGAGNSTAKLFLVGTTAQSTGTSYSNANVYATNGALHASSISTGGNVVVGGTANTNYLQLPSGIKLY